MTHHTIPQDIERSDDHQVKKETKHRNTYSYNSQHISAVKVAEKSFNTGQLVAFYILFNRDFS